MRIQNNIMAMNTHRFYTANNNAVSKSAEKLSSGYRVNRAGDDAAGLAISEKMRAEIRGLAMASKNSQDGVSMVQTAEGALTEVHSMLQRMKELAVQAASDSNENEIDRPALQQEFNQLMNEIDDVAKTTTFNDMKLLDGSFQDKVIQIGSRTGNEMEVSIGKMSAYALGLRTEEVEGFEEVAEEEAPAAAVTAADPTGTPASKAGKITFAVDAAGTITAKVDGAAGLTVTGDAGTAIAGKADTDTLAAGSAYTVIHDGVTTTLTVGDEGATVADLKAAIAGISYNVVEEEGFTATETTAITPATGVTSNLDIAGYLDDTATEAGDVDVSLTGGTLTVGTTTITGTVDADASTVADGTNNLLAANDTVVIDFGDAGTVEYTVQTGDSFIGQTIAASSTAILAKVSDDGNGGEYAVAASSTYSIGDGTTGGTTTEAIVDDPETEIDEAFNGGINLYTQKAASQTIDLCRDAINIVSTQRAELGAIQNRLEHKISNLDNTVENVSAAEARIRDVDIAKEMTNFTKNNILSQAATAMLAQANSLPQGVLSLLQ